MARRFGKKTNGVYFPDEDITHFIRSGCTVLDCQLGGSGSDGGWALGRVINIVGDSAVGKTLLAIEACANFCQQHPKGHLWYREAEAAFDIAYAARLGLPTERVDFGPQGGDSLWSTVEDIYEDLVKCITIAEKSKQPSIYVIDSLDALTARDEVARAIDKNSYKTDKAKVLSELFRRDITRRAKRVKMTIIFISQVRDRIGITFGEKTTRSGGKALTFYSSQIVYLSRISNIVQTIKGSKRVTGVRIRARIKKNKTGVSAPRDAEFIIRFYWGIDDSTACLEWLGAEGIISKAQMEKRLNEFDKWRDTDIKRYDKEMLALQQQVKDTWKQVEKRFVPPHAKYRQMVGAQ